MMRYLIVLTLLLAVAWPASAHAAPSANRDAFAVIVTRHGVRSISKAPPQYTWADWQPVAPSFLTARGYSLMTYMGQFYRVYLATHGLPVSCVSPNVYIYADTDQRTLETAQALVAGMCAKTGSIPVVHNADMPGAGDDPLFNATQWALSQHRINANASREAVMARLPSPPSAIVAAHRPDFDALQRILDARCPGTCERVAGGSTTIVDKEGLSEIAGPVKTASSYAEDLFLEYAQCRPGAVDDLAPAMRLHVLAYDVNSRNSYNALVRAGTLFAHIVAMFEAKAGMARDGIAIPDIAGDNAVFFSGHDTQLGALGGILDAHWNPGNGIVRDDMPPGSALIFEMYKRSNGEYRVRLRFAYETSQQYRHYRLVPRGTASVPVTFRGCSGPDCSVPLAHMVALVQGIENLGLVRKEWTNDSSSPVALDPLANPKWTQCKP